MSAVSEWIVKEYFETLGYMVSQPCKYAPSGRRKRLDEEVDLVVVNPLIAELKLPDYMIWTTADLKSVPLAIYLARLAMADDQLHPGELHLLRLMPAAWLKPGSSAVFKGLPTEFGPVTLKTRMAPDGKTLAVIFQPAFRKDQAPRRIVLHMPPVAGLRTLKLNGKTLKAAKDKTVVL